MDKPLWSILTLLEQCLVWEKHTFQGERTLFQSQNTLFKVEKTLFEGKKTLFNHRKTFAMTNNKHVIFCDNNGFLYVFHP